VCWKVDRRRGRERCSRGDSWGWGEGERGIREVRGGGGGEM